MADPDTVSVRISGKRGKITIKPAEGATAVDVVKEAAEQLGLTIDTSAVTFIVDGKEVPAETPVADAQKVDAAPHARLG